MDVFERGSELQLAARAAADTWTRQHLPGYAAALADGRLPVTAENLGLLQPEVAMERLAAQAAARQAAAHSSGESRQGD